MTQHQYGYFNERGDEFIVTAPDTPRPFDNFLFNNGCYANVHQTGIGYFDYQPEGQEGIQLFSGIGRICDYDVFGKAHLYSRLIYIRDNQSGEFWTVNWEPVNHPYEEYTCTHGSGYTEIMNKTLGIRVRFKIFIPLGNDAVELWTLTLTNESGRERNLSVFTYSQIQFTYKWGFDSYGDTIYRTAWMDDESNTFFAQKHPFVKPHDRLTAFFTADRPIDGFDGSMADFLGQYATLAAPLAVVRGSCGNSVGSAAATVSALQFNSNLREGEINKTELMLGAVCSTKEAFALKEKYMGHFDFHFKAMTEENQSLFSKNEMKTPDIHLNRMLNFWNKRATLFGSRWCRWGYNGYRDIVQHGYGVSSILPERTKEILREAFAYQYASGMSVRGWNPLDEKPYSDSALWLAFTLNAYLRETGDVSFLQEKIPFLDSGEETVLTHIERALDFFEDNKGEHGLLLIKYGDWNDSLTGVGQEGRGESVWLSIAYARAMTEMAELAAFCKNSEKQREYLDRRKRIVDAINETAWDGGWYKRCYSDSGRAIGSREEAAAQIFIEPQAWALIAEIADKEQAQMLISSMDDRLDTPVGYQLLAPVFREFDPEIGRISAMEPGIAENGTVYSHTNIWMILGLLRYGMADRAYTLFKKITPGYPDEAGRNIKEKALPFQYANCYFGPDHKNNPYQMEFSWITGSVAWFTNVIESSMLGVAPDFEGLRICPNLPCEFDRCEVKRTYRNAVYHIVIENSIAASQTNTAIEITADGHPVKGTLLPVYADGKTHRIKVRILQRDQSNHKNSL